MLVEDSVVVSLMFVKGCLLSANSFSSLVISLVPIAILLLVDNELLNEAS